MTEYRGVILTRRATIEEARAPLLPGSTWVACIRCGTECCASPSSQATIARGVPPVCSVCVDEIEPGPHWAVLAPGAEEEVALLERLDGEAGHA